MFDNKLVDFICNVYFIAMWIGFIAIGVGVIIGIIALVKFFAGL